MFGKINKLGYSFVVAALLLVSSTTTVRAEDFLKDSDLDGIPDTTEVSTYGTNPNNPDSDKDGILDYQEILDKTNPTDSNSSAIASVRNEKPSRLTFNDPIMWYLSRISGIASFVLFTFVISFGLTMTSKVLLKYRFALNSSVLDKHQFIATYLAFGLVILHFGSLMFDQTIKLKLHEVFIPFVAQRNFTTARGYDLNIAIALGIIAFYLALVLIITSHFRNKLVKNKTWRAIHYSAFLFYITFLVHGYIAGSDSKEPWMIGIYIWSVTQVSLLILMRIFGKKLFLPKRSAVAAKPAANPVMTAPQTAQTIPAGTTTIA